MKPLFNALDKTISKDKTTSRNTLVIIKIEWLCCYNFLEEFALSTAVSAANCGGTHDSPHNNCQCRWPAAAAAATATAQYTPANDTAAGAAAAAQRLLLVAQ